MNDLQNFKKIVTSQWGEDGIIEEIFKRIGTKNKLCVEFGAGDGIDLSNVYNLLKNQGWGGLLIESVPAYVKTWEDLAKSLNNVQVLQAYIQSSGENSLDNVLSRYGYPPDIDLVCIDIDSNDYYIFQSLQKFRPRVLLVEHNPTIPPDLDLVQAENEPESFGSSIKSILKLAHSKGYKLAAATHTNSIFVTQEEFPVLGIAEPDIEKIFDRGALTYLISAYNGGLYLHNKNGSPSYARIYEGLSVHPFSKAIRCITMGVTGNKKYSETLLKSFRPVKIFWDNPKNNGGIFHGFLVILKSLFNVVFRRKTKS